MRNIIVLVISLLMFSSCDLIVGGIQSILKIKEETEKKEDVKEEDARKPKVKNGEKRYYYDSGQLKSIVTYKDNKKVGVSHTYYKSGEKQYDIPYQDGKKHGKVLWYYKSGKVYRETEYQNGKKNGTQRKFWEDGKLKSELNYKDNMLSTGLKEYSNTGKQKSTPHIKVEEINTLRTTGEYTIRLKMSNGNKRVQFYQGELIEGKFFPKDGRGFMELRTKSGVGELKIRIQSGYQMTKDFYVVAVESTPYKNKRVLSKKIPISIRNP